MADPSSIMRRKPTDSIFREKPIIDMEEICSLGPSLQGLCPELLETFAMTMRYDELPFPSKAPRRLSAVELTRKESIGDRTVIPMSPSSPQEVSRLKSVEKDELEPIRYSK